MQMPAEVGWVTAMPSNLARRELDPVTPASWKVERLSARTVSSSNSLSVPLSLDHAGEIRR